MRWWPATACAAPARRTGEQQWQHAGDRQLAAWHQWLERWMGRAAEGRRSPQGCSGSGSAGRPASREPHARRPLLLFCPLPPCQVTATARDGKVSHMEHIFIRGSRVRFIIVPDMLKNAPMFKRWARQRAARGDRPMRPLPPRPPLALQVPAAPPCGRRVTAAPPPPHPHPAALTLRTR